MTDEAFELLQSEAEKKKIVLENKVDPSAEAFADKDMVRVILRNLLSNSLKFTPAGGYVAVMNQAARGQVQITIKDNGVGMSEEMKTSLFKSGTQLESSLGTANEKGFGIGLQLCKEYIEKNGGTMSVESDPGEGSAFSFTLETTRPA
jgi:signal transduction histidine kinase